MILEGVENETIWRVAHKWCDQNPNTSSPDNLNPLVKERLQRITRAIVFKKISLRKSNNMPVLENGLIYNMLFEFRLFWPLRNTYYHQKIDKVLLDSYYVSRAEILKWCTEEYLAFPAFWLENNAISKIPEKAKDSPASRTDKAKATSRAFAQLLWLIDPKIHPKHIAQSEVLKKFEHMKGFKPDTIREWIIDLDPIERKTGAPPKVEYKINLETGAINKNALPSFPEK